MIGNLQQTRYGVYIYCKFISIQSVISELSKMIATLLPITLFLIAYSLYLFTRRKFSYWEKKNIPHLPPTTIFGNYSSFMLLKENLGESTRKLCAKFPNAPLIGAYYGTEPSLIVQDPELIKLITTKDFHIFNGREVSEHTHKEMLTRNLFFTYGDRWKALRQNLSPIFSSSKMKSMFSLIGKCSFVFEDMLDREIGSSSVIDVRTILARFTMDCICTCAFGVDAQTMVKTENNVFKHMGDVIMDASSTAALKNIFRAIWPSIFYGSGFRVFSKDIDNFFSKLLTNIFETRNYQPSNRNDFIDFMLKMKKNNLVGDSLKNSNPETVSKVTVEIDDEFLVANCVLFFVAGYDTSSTELSFTLFELAKNPEKQAKVIEEVDAYLRRHDNKLEYECVAEVPYLEACVDEAMRLYPVLGVVSREAQENYMFPSGLTIEKGMRVHIPLYRLHTNPDFFPDPLEYRPERFYGEEKRNIKPYTYMPFGEGPRTCLGMRFARMQMAAGLITIFKKYRVELAPGMKTHLDFNPTSLITASTKDIRLKFIEREGWQTRLLAK
ncbi:cytochrome P450 6B5-like [Trichoplusia ni]|uniref:unspecific monooxygenase n=1 Tax=Trichoplusia ni TaxID=7111 RepID=A0A7E5WKM6_TRINI|nr:cytochrome P450 6B5-like [Trichoplusia ni]